MSITIEHQRFGRLTVVREVAKRGDHRMIECRCDCGNTATVRRSDLLRRTRSCGCTGGRPPTQDGLDRGYARAHARVRTARGPASEHRCIDCHGWADSWSYVRGCPGERYGPLKPTSTDSLSAPYCEHAEHYQPRCRSCHGRLDGARGVSVRQVRAWMLNRM